MMVTFYFNVRNREQALCQLVGKALAQGLTGCILTESSAASATLDRLLWEIPQTGFLPHCSAEARYAERTPFVVSDQFEHLPKRHILFNWSPNVPDGLDQYERVVEIVDSAAENRQAARTRWRTYQAAGHDPQSIDMQELTKQHG